MGFLSRLFGRVQEEPLARPEPPPREPPPEVPAAVEPEPTPNPGPEPEPEPPLAAPAVGARHALPAAPAPAPEEDRVPPPDPEPPAELSLTLDEVTAALKGAGSDGFRIGFVSREYLRAGDEERPGARRRLVSLLEEQLRARGLLADDGRFELREESPAAARDGL